MGVEGPPFQNPRGEVGGCASVSRGFWEGGVVFDLKSGISDPGSLNRIQKISGYVQDEVAQCLQGVQAQVKQLEERRIVAQREAEQNDVAY